MSSLKWKTDAGFVEFSELDDYHLENALEYCLRKRDFFDRMANGLAAERERREQSLPNRIKQVVSKVGIGL